MKITSKTLIAIILIATGCASPLSENIFYKNLIKIPVQSNDKRVNTSLVDLVQEYKYIRLETTKECLISRVNKILFYEQKCLILDKNLKTIFIFDINGNFISKIHHTGKGPGEYLSVIDFDIDAEGNIYALDVFRNTVFKYNINGKFLNTKKLTYFTRNIAVVDTSTIISFHPVSIQSDPPPGKLVLNRGGRIINFFLPLNKGRENTKRITFLKPFSLNRSSSILFNNDLSDTIYEFSKDGLNLKAKYAIDFGIKNLSPGLRDNPDYFFKSPALIEQGWHIENCFENSDYFTCSFNLEGKTWVLYYNKKNKSYTFSYCASCSSAKPKILSEMIVSAVFKDYFVSVVPKQFLIKNRDFLSKYPERGNEFTNENYNLIKNFKEDDNPVLVLYKLKKL